MNTVSHGKAEEAHENLVIRAFSSRAEAERAMERLVEHKLPADQIAVVQRGANEGGGVAARSRLGHPALVYGLAGFFLGAFLGSAFGLPGLPVTSAIGIIAGVVVGIVKGHSQKKAARAAAAESQAESYQLIADARIAREAQRALDG